MCPRLMPSKLEGGKVMTFGVLRLLSSKDFRALIELQGETRI